MADNRRSAASQAWQYLYSSKRWRKIRAMQIERYPYCQCPQHDGKGVRADHPDYGGVAVVDHVEAHRGDLKKFWAGPLQTLTKRCHDSWAQRRDANIGQGYDQRGYPINQKHHWNSQ